MTKVAEEIFTVLGRTIRYMNMEQQAYKQLLISNNVPGNFVEVLDEIFTERRKRVGSKVDLTTHAWFGVRPTFRKFVQKNKPDTTNSSTRFIFLPQIFLQFCRSM